MNKARNTKTSHYHNYNVLVVSMNSITFCITTCLASRLALSSLDSDAESSEIASAVIHDMHNTDALDEVRRLYSDCDRTSRKNDITYTNTL